MSLSIAIEDPKSDDALWCVEQYFMELSSRFETGFIPGVSAQIDPGDVTHPAGYFFIARHDDQPVGCSALILKSPDIGEIKRMWVQRSSRGMGLGRRLLETMESLAREKGLKTLRLETNASLIEAQAMYRSFGFVEVDPFNDEPYAHHWFVKRLDQDS